jgi:flagellar hook-basal body complex protein FliE
MSQAAIDQVLAQIRAASAIASGKRAESPDVRAAGAVDFGAVFKSAIQQVNGTQQQAAELSRQFELGNPGANLQDVMVSLQKANISFQTMVQVRNRLVAAYHEIMNMQV